MTLTTITLGRVLGRSQTWVLDNWKREVLAKRLPAPLNGGLHPLVWDAAQVYAYIDRALPAKERRFAAAFRAAQLAAASAPPTSEAEIAARERLDARFAASRQ